MAKSPNSRRPALSATKRSSKPGGVSAPPEEIDFEADSDAAKDGKSNGSLLLAVKLLFGVVLVLGSALVVALGAHRFGTTTDRFAIAAVKADGNRRYSSEQLLRLAGAKRGQNLFGFDLRAGERKLADDAWIESAKLTRKLPGTLEIEVSEYVAEAIASIDGTLYLVTRDGRPIAPVTGSSRHDFPIISGVSAEELAADRVRALERIALGAEILRTYRRLKLSESFKPQELHLASDGQVSLMVGSAGVTLQLGKGPFRQKLMMASRVIGKVRARGETPGIVFLDNAAHPERVVVRMR